MNTRPKNITRLGDLTQDPQNKRKHNPRNIGMITESLHEVGAARSIVIDENGLILAGNGTYEAAVEAGIESVQVVPANGETIIAVQRTGLTDEQKRRLALYDNRTAELATWDAEKLLLDLQDGKTFDGIFTDEELARLLQEPIPSLEDQDDEDETEKGVGDGLVTCPECGHKFTP